MVKVLDYQLKGLGFNPDLSKCISVCVAIFNLAITKPHICCILLSHSLQEDGNLPHSNDRPGCLLYIMLRSTKSTSNPIFKILSLNIMQTLIATKIRYIHSDRRTHCQIDIYPDRRRHRGSSIPKKNSHMLHGASIILNTIKKRHK